MLFRKNTKIDTKIGATEVTGSDKHTLRYCGSDKAVEESIIGAAYFLAKKNVVPNVAVMSHNTFRKLVGEIGTKVCRDTDGKFENKSDTSHIMSLQIYGPIGIIGCVASTFFPDDSIWLFNLNSIAPVEKETEGDESYSQLKCMAMDYNCRISL